jgi:8-amino-7-oxononanoate synthase
MGTLSKAIGSMGGYVTGSAAVIDFLRNRAPSWIYSTGLSPADTGAALAAIGIIQTEPQRRDQLWQNMTYFQQAIIGIAGLNPLPSDSAIVCLAMSNVAQALHFSQHLQNNGIYALAIRPPTVPTSRIRLTFMATHTTAQIDRLITVLRTAVAEILE